MRFTNRLGSRYTDGSEGFPSLGKCTFYLLCFSDLQFSDDQMPTAEVLIEEGEFLNPSLSAGFSSDREYATGTNVSAGGDRTSAQLMGRSLTGSHWNRVRRRMQYNDHDIMNHHHLQNRYRRHHQNERHRNDGDEGCPGATIVNRCRSPPDPAEQPPKSKRFLGFQRPLTQHHRRDGRYLDEMGAEDLSMSPGVQRIKNSNNNKQDLPHDEVSVSVIGSNAASVASNVTAVDRNQATTETISNEEPTATYVPRQHDSLPSSLFSSFLPIMAPQFDFSLRFGVPLNMGGGIGGQEHNREVDRRNDSRSEGSTPCPGPSSSTRTSIPIGLDGEDNVEVRERSRDQDRDLTFDRDRDRDRSTGLGPQRSSSATGGITFPTSISLIESHVGVGYSLGSREKPFKCEQCGQCYKYLSAFTKHKEQNHTARLPGEKPYRCETCGMQFKYLKSFKKHRLNHAVERLHPVYPRPLPGVHPGNLIGGSERGSSTSDRTLEERSVLEMLARPSNDHLSHLSLHKIGSGFAGARPANSSRRDNDDDASPVPTDCHETDGALPDTSLKEHDHIKAEIEATSSYESDDGGATRAADGSNLSSREETSQRQSIQVNNSNDIETGVGNVPSTTQLNRQGIVCSKCRNRFVNQESLRIHSLTCSERLPSRTSTSTAIVQQIPMTNEFPSKDHKLSADHRATSPSFLHEALRQQQQVALLAANFMARNASTLLPSASRVSRDRDLSVALNLGSNTGKSAPMASVTAATGGTVAGAIGDGSTSSIDNGVDASSDKDHSDMELERHDGASSAAVSSSNLSSKAHFTTSSLPLSLRPPPIPPVPTSLATATVAGGPAGFMQNMFREIVAASASGATSIGPVGQPPPDYDPGRPHICLYCGKGFRAKENLKLHIRKHTGERPFECEFCGRAFGGKSDMNRHLRIHTGERPYRCDACGKTFARADYLSKHLSTHLV